MMESLLDSIQQLANAQESLNQLIQQLEGKKSLSANEQTQTFLFDLKDYSAALSVVTDLASKEAAGTNRQAPELSSYLAEDRELLSTIRETLQIQLDNDEAPIGSLTNGGMRRLLTSIDGLIELNGLMLQDNLSFQRGIQGMDLTAVDAVTDDEPDKQGFFKRLFSK